MPFNTSSFVKFTYFLLFSAFLKKIRKDIEIFYRIKRRESIMYYKT